MIGPDLVAEIAARVEGEGLGDGLVGVLRGAYPGISFTLCGEDDIANAEPVLERAGFNVYLVDGSGPCLRLGEDYGSASGVVIAEVVSDDEDG